VMIQPSTYENVAQAVDCAFELFPLNLKGKKVLIKPNVLRASEAKEGIVTHPAVLLAVVEKVETMEPASIIVGDNPGVVSYGANEESFKKTGLMEASKGYYQNIGNESKLVEFDPSLMAQVSVSQAVLDADIIISVPKFKTHGLTILTGAIKNSYGYLTGAQKAKLHGLSGGPERFHELMVDVFRLRVPELFIVDAVVGMEGNGPASPDLRDIGQILASDSAVALDAVMATMMGADPNSLHFLHKAKEAGLGDFDMKSIEIIGELKTIPDFKLPPARGEGILQNTAIQEILLSRTLMRPKADPELCISCEDCVEQCPVSALSMIDDLPEVDPDICIACFCCQEICPEKAITLQ
ncbi:MAG: DUF362 domain-containing protein, partial [Desulfobacterales bacterium]|nr:DUF362 domain-containing protein [Desulfobacterales bacterium]